MYFYPKHDKRIEDYIKKYPQKFKEAEEERKKLIHTAATQIQKKIHQGIKNSKKRGLLKDITSLSPLEYLQNIEKNGSYSFTKKEVQFLVGDYNYQEEKKMLLKAYPLSEDQDMEEIIKEIIQQEFLWDFCMVALKQLENSIEELHRRTR